MVRPTDRSAAATSTPWRSRWCLMVDAVRGVGATARRRRRERPLSPSWSGCVDACAARHDRVRCSTAARRAASLAALRGARSSTYSSSAAASPAPASRSTRPAAVCRSRSSSESDLAAAARADGRASSRTAGCATSPPGSSVSPGSPPSSATACSAPSRRISCSPMTFVIPRTCPRSAGASAWSARIGMGIADALRVAARTPAALPRTQLGRRRPACGRCPRRCSADVRGGFVTSTDRSRTMRGWSSAIARTAASHGARIITHCSASDVHRDGARSRDELTGDSYDVRRALRRRRRRRLVRRSRRRRASAAEQGRAPVAARRGARQSLVRVQHPRSGHPQPVTSSPCRARTAPCRSGSTDDAVDDIEDEPDGHRRGRDASCSRPCRPGSPVAGHRGRCRRPVRRSAAAAAQRR